MVLCPRCAQLVDETTRTTCPHCFTSLAGAGLPTAAPPAGQAAPVQPIHVKPQAPQQSAPQLSRSAGTRVSLTGEVIHDDAAVPPPTYVGGGATARPPGVAAPQRVGLAQPRAAYGASRTEAPAKSGGGTIVAVVLGLLVLGGAGVGGWWFLTPHTTPKMVVQQFDTAIGAQDWKTVYTLIEVPADAKAKYPDATAFASDMTTQIEKVHSNPMIGPAVDAAFKAYQTAKVGEATITGDTAVVPITLKMSLPVMGQTIEKSTDQQIPLRKVNGAWKIDGLQGAIPNGMGSGSR